MKQLQRHKLKNRHWMSKILTLIIVISINACVHDPFLDQTPTPTDGGNPPVTPPPITTTCETDGTVCFESSVLPIFLSSCAKSGCHDSKTAKEGYVLDSYATIVKKGISPGNASGSKLYKVLFATGEDQMPPDAPLTQAQKDSIKTWINEGAKNTVNCNCACDQTKFTFAITIQPLLASTCVGCHKPGSLSGNVDLSTYASVKNQISNGKLLGSVQHTTGYFAMPPNGKLSDCQIAQIKNWIDAGAANN